MMTPSKVITFFAPHSTHFVETMAFFLAWDPQFRVRVVTARQRGGGVTEHQGTLDRLESQELIEVVDVEAEAMDSSLLVFGLTRHRPQPPALAAWLRRSESVAIFPEASRYGGRADWLRELARSFPHFLRARFLILERPALPLDFRFGCRRRVIYTATVHPQFLADPHVGAAMFGPVRSESRRFRFAFLGNRQPPERSARLDACRKALEAQPGISITSEFAAGRASAGDVLWIEYDIAAGTRGLDSMDYVAALSEADFCLSPPGWGLNWTHRTIEAAIRGAIPVIEDPEMYGVPFVDGVNCVIATRGDWAHAIRRCLAFSPAQVAALREGVLRLREERLLVEVAARDFRRDFLNATT